MTTNTTNLNLVLYDATADVGETFLSFRVDIAGASGTSNFELIDTAYGDMATLIANTEGAFYLPTTGTNTYSATNAYITAYYTGLAIILSVVNNNTTASTLQINALGAKDLKKVDSAGTISALSSGDLIVNKQYLFVYDGTRWILVSATFDIHGLTTKATISNADEFSIADSDATFVGSKITWTLIKSTLKTYFDTLYSVAVKALGSELDTGTDDAKFATALALKTSHNIPSIAPGSLGNIISSNGTDWVSTTPINQFIPLARGWFL